MHPSSVQPGPVSEQQQNKDTLPVHPTEPTQQLLASVAQPVIDSASTRVPVGYKASTLAPAPGHGQRLPSMASSSNSDVEVDESGTGTPSDTVERIINVKNCPLCHRPRLNSRAEVDIVTHLAVCASQDWARMDRIVVSNFVTASQAQRKWYTKILGKVSAGNYKLGAVSRDVAVGAQFCSWILGRILQISLYKIALPASSKKRRCRCMLGWVSDCCIRWVGRHSCSRDIG